ncbi:MAG TPA: 2,3,4,5-tetrahydropyridine-2,6-dicarboxylate N-succinyltransferase [Caldimonas sp.]|jgi:2,3,4,5-tetrahydropyridine-2-carboxylate N-succinyltransferase|nr:2,3,4,5-tetrahydropyridine-2,6-dicarboxylate N-succinyltransferase [Caldimonas sp.]HEV7577497.1 2,3,4,5-tetrahydropyridine-2,6-dicarboxylate N-succinyltransferase [Caldimonas sp.]
MSRASADVSPYAGPGGIGLDSATLAELKAVIEHAWLAPPGTVQPPVVREVVEFVIDALDAGKLRVAERQGVGRWTVNEWVKQAVLLSFRLTDSKVMRMGGVSYFDKIDSKFAGLDEPELRASGVRTVPPAMVRYGAYLARDVVVMPSFINIGAYVDEGTMVDGWANVGSCAQIGKRVHLSVGVCIGGVLEPVQAQPTIVEDNCFIGAHSSVVEGVIVEENSVIAMGVHLGQSTKILDRESRTISYGRVPAGSVVIAGTLPAPDGSYSTSCAIIVKKVDAQSRVKTSVNDLLRS